MFRIALFCLAIGSLGQLVPTGCPLLFPDGAALSERGSIATEATAPASAAGGETVTLTAAASADEAGGDVSYSWVQIAGPGVKILDATEAQASFTAPSLATDQTLRFVVTTSNARGDVGLAELAVIVAADPNFGSQGQGSASGGPLARAGADREVPASTIITLDGSNSRGVGLTYRWRQVAGAAVTLTDAEKVRATFVAPAYDAVGNNGLEFELEVRDSRDRRSTDRVTITIREVRPDEETDPKPQVRIRTSRGSITVELDRQKAPVSVNNFLQYVNDDFYAGTIFHRVIADFMIQGGGFEPGLIEKEPRDPIVNESHNGLKNLRGTIAMARTADADSATSQFYINVVDNASLDYQSGQPGYAVFGEVIDGMDVVDAIAGVETETREGMQDVPVEDILILGVDRITTTTSPPDAPGSSNPPNQPTTGSSGNRPGGG